MQAEIGAIVGGMPPEVDRQDGVIRLLHGVFFASGVSALIYQLVWQRALFVLYGTNTESVTVVVAAFMAGLGLGSLTGGALSRRVDAALLLVFAAVEVAIGLYGLASLGIFDAIGQVTSGSSLAVTGLVSFVAVLVPTCLMGATLPLLVAYVVRRTGNVGRAVGSLYHTNTLGSAFACFAAAFYLFRLLGMAGSVQVAATLNLLAAAVALIGHRRAATGPA